MNEEIKPGPEMARKSKTAFSKEIKNLAIKGVKQKRIIRSF